MKKVININKDDLKSIVSESLHILETRNKNTNLNKAKSAKNDEYYTRYEDIATAVACYKEYFKGKTVFCNCDNIEWSNFPKFFIDNFESLGLNMVIVSHLNDTSRGFATIYDGKKFFKRVISGNNDKENAGDFRSLDSIELLNKSDIVVTNPPFSLFRDFVDLMFSYNKKFLIVGHLNGVKYANVFPHFKNNEMWVGPTPISNFRLNSKEITNPKIQKMGDDGYVYQHFGNTCWYTNIGYVPGDNPLTLDKHYNDSEYTKFDNYDAINSNTKNIPIDYDGVIGVPISYMQKHNPDDYELIGTLGAGGEFNYGKAMLNGEEKFPRILIRRKNKDNVK